VGGFASFDSGHHAGVFPKRLKLPPLISPIINKKGAGQVCG
jgi:hypothetical protein